MFHKTALLIASLAASLTLAFALAAAGFAPGAAAPSLDAATASTTEPTGTAAPLIQVDKVYVPAPVAPETITVHKVAQTASGDGESDESEGDD